MKITKPMSAGLLVRPYRWRNQSQIGLSVMILIDATSGAPMICPESRLWNVAADQLDSHGVLDLGIPKVHPEFLVSGNAYTAFQENKSAVAVNVQVNDKRRVLAVTGERYFIDEQMSEPEPFESLPMTWQNSFGGPQVENNPMGKGGQDTLKNGVVVREVPNVEDMQHRMSSRNQRLRPVNMGAQSFTWPVRFSKIGNYSENWQHTDFPGFFPDMDPTIFNAAQEEQIWFDKTEFADNTQFLVHNMHPSKPQWSGNVPAWRARCIVDLQKDYKSEVITKDVTLNLKTLWLVPHLESYVLIFQNALPCWFEDGHEIRHILAALEWKHSPKPAQHYADFMRVRENHDESALTAYQDEALLPENVQVDTFEPVAQSSSHLAARLCNMQNYMQMMARESLASMGLDPNQYLPEFVGPLPPTLTDLRVLPQEQQIRDRQMEQLQKDMAELKDAASEFKRSGGKDKSFYDLLGGEEYVNQMLEDATAIQPAPAEAHETSLGILTDHLEKTSKESEEERAKEQSKLFSMSAHLVGNRFVEDSSYARKLRKDIQTKLSVTSDLSYLDLSGADLSSLEFEGINFEATVFNRANLKGAVFKNCQFPSAALCKAALSDTQFLSCHFEETNFNTASLQKCLFNDCNFESFSIEGWKLQKCKLQSSRLSQLVLINSDIQNCEFAENKIEALQLIDTSLKKTSLVKNRFIRSAATGSVIDDCVFEDCYVRRMAVTGGGLRNTQFTGSELDAISIKVDQPVLNTGFNESHIKNSSLRELVFENTSFDGTVLDQCDLSLGVFKKCSFTRARLVGSIVQRARFYLTDFSGANLSDAMFGRSAFEAVNFTRVNFFRTELAFCEFAPDCIEHNNYLKMAQTEPTERKAL